MLFLGKGSYANNEAKTSNTAKQAARYLCSRPEKNYRKHLTAIAASLYPVSLNIVLQKAPISTDQGFFISFQMSLNLGGFLQYA